MAELTHLNSDSNDFGPVGPEAVEVYLPLDGRGTGPRVGVMEVYLPYAPISADVTSGLHELYRDMAIGLGVLVPHPLRPLGLFQPRAAPAGEA